MFYCDNKLRALHILENNLVLHAYSIDPTSHLKILRNPIVLK